MTSTPTSLTEHIASLIEARKFIELRKDLQRLEAPDIAEIIAEIGFEHPDYEAVIFRLLPKDLAVRTFEHLPLDSQEELLKSLGDKDAKRILDDMSADDRTALLEELPGKVTRRMLNLLSSEERLVATQLLGYPEYSTGRLMTPDYVALKAGWTVQEALQHIRIYGRDSETLNNVYVVEKGGKLIDDIRMREVLLASPDTKIGELMDHQFVALNATDDQEESIGAFRKHDRSSLPVVDSSGILVGIVTIDDVIDVIEEETTEDIHKLVGVQVLEEPYMNVPLLTLVRKRAFWLIILFFGQMFTATAMGFYEDELARALVLAIFVPLIISSGGNSGSQAATLIIRALTLGEIRLRDWWRVMRREVLTSLIIGAILGFLGFMRIAGFQLYNGQYGEHWFFIALTIGLALIGVVMWGSLSGSILPFLLKRFGLDPATSSAPLVATLSDVTGLMIYFSIAVVVLRGTLL